MGIELFLRTGERRRKKERLRLLLQIDVHAAVRALHLVDALHRQMQRILRVLQTHHLHRPHAAEIALEQHPQALRLHRLQQIMHRVQVKRLHSKLARRREKRQLHPWQQYPRLPCRGDAIQPLHINVQQQKIIPHTALNRRQQPLATVKTLRDRRHLQLRQHPLHHLAQTCQIRRLILTNANAQHAIHLLQSCCLYYNKEFPHTNTTHAKKRPPVRASGRMSPFLTKCRRGLPAPHTCRRPAARRRCHRKRRSSRAGD